MAFFGTSSGNRSYPSGINHQTSPIDAHERGVIAGLKEALEIVENVDWRDGTPAHYLDNWIQQAIRARISELESNT